MEQKMLQILSNYLRNCQSFNESFDAHEFQERQRSCETFPLDLLSESKWLAKFHGLPADTVCLVADSLPKTGFPQAKIAKLFLILRYSLVKLPPPGQRKILDSLIMVLERIKSEKPETREFYKDQILLIFTFWKDNYASTFEKDEMDADIVEKVQSLMKQIPTFEESENQLKREDCCDSAIPILRNERFMEMTRSLNDDFGVGGSTAQSHLSKELHTSKVTHQTFETEEEKLTVKMLTDAFKAKNLKLGLANSLFTTDVDQGGTDMNYWYKETVYSYILKMHRTEQIRMDDKNDYLPNYFLSRSNKNYLFGVTSLSNMDDCKKFLLDRVISKIFLRLSQNTDLNSNVVKKLFNALNKGFLKTAIFGGTEDISNQISNLGFIGSDYSKEHPLVKDIASKLQDHCVCVGSLSNEQKREINKLVDETLEAMRLEALQSIKNILCRVQEQFLKKYWDCNVWNCLRPLLRDPIANIQTLAQEIVMKLVSDDTADTHSSSSTLKNCSEFFLHCIAYIESCDDFSEREKCFRFILDQISKPNRCNYLVEQEILKIDVIIGFFIRQNKFCFPEKEIIADCLSQFFIIQAVREISEVQFIRLFDCSSSADIILALRFLLMYVENHHAAPSRVTVKVVRYFNEQRNNLLIQAYVLLILLRMTNKSGVNFNLFQHLLECDECIKVDGLKMDLLPPDTTTLPQCIPISRLASLVIDEIIANPNNKLQVEPKTINLLVHAVLNSRHHQTQLICAKVLFQGAQKGKLHIKRGQTLDSSTFLSLHQYFCHLNKELAVYIRYFYLDYLSQLLAIEKTLTPIYLDSLHKLYCADGVLLIGDQNFGITVNRKLLELYQLIVRARMQLPVDCFQFFLDLNPEIRPSTTGENLNCEKNMWLEILCTSVANKQVLPQSVISQLAIYLSTDARQETSLLILIGAASNGQFVPDSVIERFAFNLVRSDDESLRTKIKEGMSMFEECYDLSLLHFQLLQLETAAHQLFLPSVEKRLRSILKLVALGSPVTQTLWKQLRNYSFIENKLIIQIVKQNLIHAHPISNQSMSWISHQIKAFLSVTIPDKDSFFDVCEIMSLLDRNYDSSLDKQIISQCESLLDESVREHLKFSSDLQLHSSSLDDCYQCMSKLLSLLHSRCQRGEMCSLLINYALVNCLQAFVTGTKPLNCPPKYEFDKNDQAVFLEFVVKLILLFFETKQFPNDRVSVFQIEDVLNGLIQRTHCIPLIEFLLGSLLILLRNISLTENARNTILVCLQKPLNEQLIRSLSTLLHSNSSSRRLNCETSFQIELFNLDNIVEHELYIDSVSRLLADFHGTKALVQQLLMKAIPVFERILREDIHLHEKLLNLLTAKNCVENSACFPDSLRDTISFIGQCRSNHSLSDEDRQNPETVKRFMKLSWIKSKQYRQLIPGIQWVKTELCNSGVLVEDEEVIHTILTVKHHPAQIPESSPESLWTKLILLSDLALGWNLSTPQEMNLYVEWTKTEEASLREASNVVLKLIHAIEPSVSYQQFIQMTKYLSSIRDLPALLEVLTRPKAAFLNVRELWIYELLMTTCLSNNDRITLLLLSRDLASHCVEDVPERFLAFARHVLGGGFPNASSVLTVLKEIHDVGMMDVICCEKFHSFQDLVVFMQCTVLISTLVEHESLPLPSPQPDRDLLKQRLHNLLTLHSSWTFDSILKLFKLRNTSDSVDDLIRGFSDILYFIEQYTLSPLVYYQKIADMIQLKPPKNWLMVLNNSMIGTEYNVNGRVKSAAELVAEYCKINLKSFPNLKSEFQENLLKNFCAVLDHQKHLSNWDQQKVKAWTESARASLTNENSVLEAVAVLMHGNHLLTSRRLTNTQVLSCLVALEFSGQRNTKSEKGVLLQVLTGEGKTIIISILAIVLVLQGNHVDIITSSPVEAERSWQEMSPLYRMFEVSVGHNVEHSIYMSGARACYDNKVVYGTVAQFQFDTLRDEYSLLNTKNGRTCDFLIVDEVDHVLIDECAQIAKLSSPIPGMDQFQSIYLLINHRIHELLRKICEIEGKFYLFYGTLHFDDKDQITYLSYFDSKNHYANPKDRFKTEDVIEVYKGPMFSQVCHLIEGDIGVYMKNDIESYIAEMKEKKIASLTKKGSEYFKLQLSKWVENALLAVFRLNNNAQYIAQDGLIKPISYDSNGVVQNSTQWSDGLQQSLQIKHQIPLTAETVTTNYISTMAYIKKYKYVCGLTGTLGSPTAREHVNNAYKFKSVEIPCFREKCLVKMPMMVISQPCQWMMAIYQEVEFEIRKGRGVLIICKLIQDAEMLARFIQSQRNDLVRSVKLYTMNGVDQEREIQRIQQHEVIIATLLGGRGMDIKADDINRNGGMHVILTFLSTDKRNEEQALARTARQGRLGTGRIILCKQKLLSEGYTLKQMDNLEIAREAKEGEALWRLFKEFLDVITFKDELFAAFQLTVQRIRKDARTAESNNKGAMQCMKDTWNYLNGSLSLLSNTEKIYIDAVEERWIEFLRESFEGSFAMKSEKETIHRHFTTFITTIEIAVQKKELISNSLHLIALADEITYSGKVSVEQSQEALQLYDRAISQDIAASAAAFVGKSALYLKGKSDLRNPSTGRSYKTLARKCLQEAIKLLQEEMAGRLALQRLLIESQTVDVHSSLMLQFQTKSNILAEFVQSLENNQRSIQRAQRYITIAETVKYGKMQMKLKQNHGASSRSKIACELKQTNYKSFIGTTSSDPIYDVQLHDQSSFSDIWTNDQVLNTISKVVQSTNQIAFEQLRISVPNVDVGRIQQSLLNPTVFYQCNTRKEALEILQSQNSFLQQAWNLVNGEVRLNLKVEQHNKTEINMQGISLSSAVATLQDENEFGDVSSNGCLFTLDFRSLRTPFNHYDLEYLKLNSVEEVQEQLDVIPCQTFDVKLTGTVKLLRQLVEKYGEELLSEVSVCSQEDKYEADTSDIDEPIIFHVQVFKNRVQPLKEFLLKIAETAVVSLNLKGLEKEKWKIIGKDSLLRPNSLQLESVKYNEVNLQDSITFPKGFVNVTFYQLDSYQMAQKLVYAIRSNQLDLILGFKGISREQVDIVMSSADVGEEELKIESMKSLYDHYQTQEEITKELSDFHHRGIKYLFVIDERKFLQWKSMVLMTLISAAQIGAGIWLFPTGFGTDLGVSLITEGFSDSVLLFKAGVNRNHTWTDYAKQKAVSLLISAASLGLQKLKDGGKGAMNLLSGLENELIESSTSKLITAKGETIGTTIVEATRELTKMANQMVVVTAGETVVRESANYCVDSLVQCGIEQYQSGLLDSVFDLVETKFFQTELHDLVLYLLALDALKKQTRFEGFVQSCIHEILSPQGDFFMDQWNSVGLPLVKGILSSSQYCGSAASAVFRIGGILHGAYDFQTIIDKFHSEMWKRLQQFETDITPLNQVFQLHCPLSPSDAQTASSVLAGYQFYKQDLSFHPKRVELQRQAPCVAKGFEFLEELESIKEKVKVKKMITAISKALTARLVGVMKNQIIAPTTTWATSLAVSYSSSWAQDKWNRKKLEEKQTENKGKLNDLDEKSKTQTLTADEQNQRMALEHHNKKIAETLTATEKNGSLKKLTTRDLTQETAKLKIQEFSKLENAHYASQKSDQLPPKDIPPVTQENVNEYADEITQGKRRAGLSEMVKMAVNNGLKFKIVDENYVPTPEDKDMCLFVRLDTAEGHWVQMNSDTGSIIPNLSSNGDCGYALIASITGKPIDQLKQETAESIRNDSTSFIHCIEVQKYLETRFPLESKKLNMEGGEDIFASHNCTNDGEAKDANHRRVLEFVEDLRKLGFCVWTDGDYVKKDENGNVVWDDDFEKKMEDGIKCSPFIVIFVTPTYLQKIQGLHKLGENDNCYKEFQWALENNKAIVPISIHPDVTVSPNMKLTELAPLITIPEGFTGDLSRYPVADFSNVNPNTAESMAQFDSYFQAHNIRPSPNPTYSKYYQPQYRQPNYGYSNVTDAIPEDPFDQGIYEGLRQGFAPTLVSI